MKELVFLLEEPSAADLLQQLLPRLFPNEWVFRFIPYEGKQDLEKRMGALLQAWQNPRARFVVLRDQDAGDCVQIKKDLVARCAKAGKPDALVRIACRELEAWVLGDLEAFAAEFDCPQAARQVNKAKFRQPDLLVRPVEELRRFHPGYQKRDGARRMGQRLDLARNRSPSFRAFCLGVQRLVTGVDA